MRVKTPMCQTRNGYLRSEGKAAFFCSAGLFSDIPAMKKSKTHLVSSGGRPETGAILICSHVYGWNKFRKFSSTRKQINIIIILAGNNLSCPKLVSECHAELRVTLTKHNNETHAMKMTNHNSKTAIPNVEIEEYQNAMAK